MTPQEKSVQLSAIDAEIRKKVSQIKEHEETRKKIEKEVKELKEQIEKHEKMRDKLTDIGFEINGISNDIEMAIENFNRGYCGRESKQKQGELEGYMQDVKENIRSIQIIKDKSLEESTKKKKEVQQKEMTISQIKRTIKVLDGEKNNLERRRKEVENIIVDWIF